MLLLNVLWKTLDLVKANLLQLLPYTNAFSIGNLLKLKGLVCLIVLFRWLVQQSRYFIKKLICVATKVGYWIVKYNQGSRYCRIKIIMNTWRIGYQMHLLCCFYFKGVLNLMVQVQFVNLHHQLHFLGEWQWYWYLILFLMLCICGKMHGSGELGNLLDGSKQTYIVQTIRCFYKQLMCQIWLHKIDINNYWFWRFYVLKICFERLLCD